MQCDFRKLCNIISSVQSHRHHCIVGGGEWNLKRTYIIYENKHSNKWTLRISIGSFSTCQEKKLLFFFHGWMTRRNESFAGARSHTHTNVSERVFDCDACYRCPIILWYKYKILRQKKINVPLYLTRAILLRTDT